MAGDVGVKTVDLAALRALLAQAKPGPFEAACNTREPGSPRDLSHDDMLALLAERIRRGGSRMYVVHLPERYTDEGPLVVADIGNGPTSEVHAALIAALLNAAPVLLDTAEESERLRAQASACDDVQCELEMHEAYVADLTAERDALATQLNTNREVNKGALSTAILMHDRLKESHDALAAYARRLRKVAQSVHADLILRAGDSKVVNLSASRWVALDDILDEPLPPALATTEPA